MELSNVKVDWENVLDPEIQQNEKLHPDLPVRDMYRWVIDDLNNNRMRSRVIMSLDRVIGYAFLYPATGFSDRYFASFGFKDPLSANTERSNILLDWAIRECRKENRKLLFNEPFNTGPEFHASMDERGIRSLKRVEMTANPGSFRFSSMNLPDGYTRTGVQSADLSAYSDALYSAFKSEDESILISSYPAERKKVLSDILSGRLYGAIIHEGSFALLHAGKVVGGVTTLLNSAIPFISDLFIVPEEQGKGLGSYLTENVVSSLRIYKEVRLWTDERSIAHEMYLHRGFTDTGRTETLYYLRTGKPQG